MVVNLGLPKSPKIGAAKPSSWWYKRASGGGSLLDYLGYGVTLGTWFLDGDKPIEVTSIPHLSILQKRFGTVPPPG